MKFSKRFPDLLGLSQPEFSESEDKWRPQNEALGVFCSFPHSFRLGSKVTRSEVQIKVLRPREQIFDTFWTNDYIYIYIYNHLYH